MFENLSKRFLAIFSNLRNRGILTPEIISTTLREIRVALLEADVALPVVKKFISELGEKLEGREIINSISPEQAITKAVYNELVKLLSGKDEVPKPLPQYGNILMIGLQGTGKTTTVAKLARFLQMKHGKKVLLVSCDVQRPAAIDQLQTLANRNNIAFFDDVNLPSDDAISIAKKAINFSKEFDITIFDTAGRLHTDKDLMQELSELNNLIKPKERILVIDSLMGQDAINTAETFNQIVPPTGIILTRIDGDSKGGAALSVKSVTNCDIKFLCFGEKIEDIEVFHPDRIVSRIFDKGDISSLFENIPNFLNPEEEEKINSYKDFDLILFERCFSKMSKTGGISNFFKFIPGMRNINEQLKDKGIDTKIIPRQMAIIKSMTIKERKNPDILNASRKRRIAKGCGQDVCSINKLLKQFEEMKKVLKRLSKIEKDPKILMKNLKNMI